MNLFKHGPVRHLGLSAIAIAIAFLGTMLAGDTSQAYAQTVLSGDTSSPATGGTFQRPFGGSAFFNYEIVTVQIDDPANFSAEITAAPFDTYLFMYNIGVDVEAEPSNYLVDDDDDGGPPNLSKIIATDSLNGGGTVASLPPGPYALVVTGYNPVGLSDQGPWTMELTGISLISTADTGSQSSSQIATGSNVMFQGASQNISTGIGNAIAERFFDGGGSSFNVGPDGSTLNAYVSVRGIGQAAQDMRSSRLAMYDAPEAVRAIYEATGGVEAGMDGSGAAGEEVSPYLLGADVVPYVPTSPEQTTWNAWVRGTYTHYDGDAFSGDTWNGIAGMDYLITDSVLVGVLAGYENGDFDFDTTNGAFEGSGFTAGVYVGARLSPSIVADAFLTHSWLDYDTRSGTATGSTDASRWLVSMNVTGSYDLSDTLTLEPNVRIFYAHENQDGYTLSDATVVAANTIDSGRLSLGPRLRYLVADDWTAFISAHGEYDLSSEDQTNSTLPDFDGLLSARIGLGVDGTFWNGWSLSLAGDVSGIGSGDYLAYTGTGKIRVPLN